MAPVLVLLLLFHISPTVSLSSREGSALLAKFEGVELNQQTKEKLAGSPLMNYLTTDQVASAAPKAAVDDVVRQMDAELASVSTPQRMCYMQLFDDLVQSAVSDKAPQRFREIAKSFSTFVHQSYDNHAISSNNCSLITRRTAGASCPDPVQTVLVPMFDGGKVTADYWGCSINYTSIGTQLGCEYDLDAQDLDAWSQTLVRISKIMCDHPESPDQSFSGTPTSFLETASAENATAMVEHAMSGIESDIDGARQRFDDLLRKLHQTEKKDSTLSLIQAQAATAECSTITGPANYKPRHCPTGPVTDIFGNPIAGGDAYLCVEACNVDIGKTDAECTQHALFDASALVNDVLMAGVKFGMQCDAFQMTHAMDRDPLTVPDYMWKYVQEPKEFWAKGNKPDLALAFGWSQGNPNTDGSKAPSFLETEAQFGPPKKRRKRRNSGGGDGAARAAEERMRCQGKENDPTDASCYSGSPRDADFHYEATGMAEIKLEQVEAICPFEVNDADAHPCLECAKKAMSSMDLDGDGTVYVKEFRAKLKAIDRDDDGKISEDEFMAGFMDEEGCSSFALALFEEFDLDGSGFIELAAEGAAQADKDHAPQSPTQDMNVDDYKKRDNGDAENWIDKNTHPVAAAIFNDGVTRPFPGDGSGNINVPTPMWMRRTRFYWLDMMHPWPLHELLKADIKFKCDYYSKLSHWIIDVALLDKYMNVFRCTLMNNNRQCRSAESTARYLAREALSSVGYGVVSPYSFGGAEPGICNEPADFDIRRKFVALREDLIGMVMQWTLWASDWA